jgi:hypothetical protein
MPRALLRQIPESPENPPGLRLGRHIRHDARSARFPFAARPESRREVVSRPAWPRRIGILDQGSLGSCTGNAGAGWVGSDNADRAGITQIVAPPEPSCPLGAVDEDFAIHLYSDATVIDPWPGTYPPEDTGSDGTSIAKVLKAWGLCAEYSWAFGGVSDVLAALQSGPVLIGIPWYSSMFSPTAEGECRITAGAYVAGGHEIVANGEIDMERRRLGLDNSWSRGWGLDGRFYLSFDTLDRLLGEEGDATVPHAVAVIDPDPEPQPEPVPARPGCLGQVTRLFRGR